MIDIQPVTYGSLNIGDEFKFDLSNAFWYKKIKLGRKKVYIRLDGHFTFLPPCGAKNNLIVYPKKNENQYHQHFKPINQ